MNVFVKNAPIKADHSISITKYYYELLQEINSIISIKIPAIELDLAL